jgi:non-ribosomal peptide synthetase component E (peptide arylation enzyme)
VTSDHTDTLGGRLPLADPAALNPAQREIFDRMATKIVPWANDAQFQSTAALCARKLAGYKRPTSITVMDAIPKNAVGKTDKAPLRTAHLKGTSV